MQTKEGNSSSVGRLEESDDGDGDGNGDGKTINLYTLE